MAPTALRTSLRTATLTALAVLATAAVPAPSFAATEPPLQVIAGLVDTTDPVAVGLPRAANAETITVAAPGDDDLKFNHGVVLMPFKNRLYAQWQSSAKDEDAPDTIVVYATSEDGTNWSASAPLTAPRTDGYTSSGGWWTDGETLVAYLNVWPSALTPRGGYTEYVTSTDGVRWSSPKRVLGADGQPVDGIIEQDVKALPDGRILTAFHVQPGLFVKPYYTDDPLGVSGWKQGQFTNQPNNSGMSRELEPSWYQRADGSIVMVFRDQGGNTFRKLAAVSTDNGETWSDSVVTNVPDGRTKQSAGNLPDGTAYLVGNPTGTRNRYPLSVLVSADGVTFDVAYNLRTAEDLQPLRYVGLYKNLGYSYPKSIVWKDHLYVAYATNKEDVQISRLPVADISLRDDAATVPGQGVLSHDNGRDTGLQDGDYTVTMNLWWGQNASSVRLYENGKLVASRALAYRGVGPQSIAIPVTGRPNGTYVYTAELVNSKGITATRPLTVKVTQAAPATPVLSHDNTDRDGTYRVTANLWWGTNATSYRFLENGAVVAEGALTANTPQAQTAAMAVTGRASGDHTYVVEFSNAAGTTVSKPITVTVDR
ncbi:Chitinase A, N-terminal domain [Micromonospora pallida]|uniref:Chitinase A, N-terminal domain n=1 Tax=Micromonospora pallida TaxID=145854 RepID=A0A1C6SFT8_9ACTN|nr:exo-alpha-sialidase [Micromonospora pallida]SCL28273.1 Chitinase A, N-terminal domain [Micromonospora pallida]